MRSRHPPLPRLRRDTGNLAQPNGSLPLARMEYGQPDDVAILVAHHNIVVSDFAVGGVASLLEVDVERVGFGIV